MYDSDDVSSFVASEFARFSEPDELRLLEHVTRCQQWAREHRMPVVGRSHAHEWLLIRSDPRQLERKRETNLAAQRRWRERRRERGQLSLWRDRRKPLVVLRVRVTRRRRAVVGVQLAWEI